MGYSLPSHEKLKMAKRFQTQHAQYNGNHSEKTGESLRIAVEKDLLAFYNDETEMVTVRKKYQNSNYTHGIVIGVEKDKTLWLYDNGNNVRKPVENIADVAPYLFTYWRTFVFKISL